LIAGGVTAGRWRAALAVMMASGFAGLGYQIVWTQQCALWLGHEAAAVLAVVTAFFGGLAVGGLLFGPSIERSRRPARWYAGCELLIALWSLLLALAMAPFSAALLALTGDQPSPLWQWTVAFAGSFLLLLPATAAMGATLPAMAKVAAGWQREGRAVAPLYAANTFGAVIGVLAIAFLLMPTLGLLRTAGVCIGLNLLCALAALLLLPDSVDAASMPATQAKPASSLRFRLFATGLLGIGYEVLVVRVLSEVAEDTVYTFALLLAVYLVGSAAGAAGYARWSRRARDPASLGDRLLIALASACLLGTASLWAAGALHALALQAFGSSMAAALAAEALLALLAFGLPTLAMGALFSQLAAEAQRGGASLGRALGINTLGACAAAPLFGVLALPLLGARSALLLIVAGYLLLALRSWRSPLLWTPALALLAVAVLAPPLAYIDVPDGGRVVRYQEGVMAAVSVVEDGDGVRRLRINNRQQEGSSATRRVDGRQALLPLLLHPAPQRVLFLGLGTGITSSTAAADPRLAVTAVELLPEVIAASGAFIAAPGQRRPTLLAADARRYVRASGERYDLVIADNFHPARSGSGSLYTVEHYAAVRERLADGGRFCQWLPLHQLDLDSLRSIVQSFLRVYPDAQALLASNSLETPVLGLLGGREPLRVELAAVEARLAAAMALSPARYGIEDGYALLGSFVAGPAALRRLAGDAAANTDDLPVVAYRAPRLLYAPDSRPRDRLIALLDALSIAPEQLLAAGSDAGQARRLAAYWQARDRFIVLGRDVRPSDNVDALLARIGGPLLGLLRASPDFRPAYDPLLQMATALAASDAPQAAALLDTLIAIQPARPEAAAARRALATPQP